MLTSTDCLYRYGEPEKEAGMMLWDVPPELEVGVVPRRIYCNRDLVVPLAKAFGNLITSGCVRELRTWDGCFNIRKKRGAQSASLHSWGVAVDVNAGWNGFGAKPTLTPEFVKCFEDAGFDWGGRWRLPDGMHFQLHELPARGNP